MSEAEETFMAGKVVDAMREAIPIAYRGAPKFRELYCAADGSRWFLTYSKGLGFGRIPNAVVRIIHKTHGLYRSHKGSDEMLTLLPETFSHMADRKPVFTIPPERPKVFQYD